MKRPIFIIVGIILVLVLVVIWVYVLFFGTPKNNTDLFSNLSFGETTDTTLPTEEAASSSQPVVDVASQKRLRQLTTRPVVGYAPVRSSASSTPFVYYIEAGTGHVFSINIETGEEERVSAVTFPASSKGSITPDGQFALVQSGNGREFTVNNLASSSDSISTHSLAEKIISFAATADNNFLYAIQTSNSVIGMLYNPISQKSETIFTVPFRDATIGWGKVASGPHFIYPKASSKLEGFVLEAEAGKVKRLPLDGYGLAAGGNVDKVLYSKLSDEGKYQSFVYNLTTTETILSPLAVLPEKCAFSLTADASIICAVGTKAYTMETPDTWYRGEVSYADGFWELDPISQSASFIADTQAESGQELDITDLTVDGADENLYFINKNNQTLWLYEWR